MSEYTDSIIYESREIYPDEEGYYEALCRLAGCFRTFDRALTDFIVLHGYEGDPSQVCDKTMFLERLFKEEGIFYERRTLQKWFVNPGRITRKKAIELCFALRLTFSQTEDFLRRYYMDRGLDCHSISEAVAYFCLKKGLLYKNYSRMLEYLRQKISDSQEDISKEATDGGPVYTTKLQKEIDGINDEETLVTYLLQHAADYRQNNVRATKTFQRLWQEIVCAEGLIRKEQNIFHNIDETETNVGKEVGAWEAYLHILGLERKSTGQCLMKKGYDRSLKKILQKSEILPMLAADVFPEREGIALLYAGKNTMEYERIRKLLILASFYSFWMKRSLSRKVFDYAALPHESETYVNWTNQLLWEVGYPALYYGNPYDWIYMFAAEDNAPIESFRAYMGELLGDIT